MLGSGDRDYHYDITPQALFALRVIAGRRAALDLTAREYVARDLVGFGAREHEYIFRGDASIALRVFRQHALAVNYLVSRRDGTGPGLPRLRQARSTLGVFYTLLGSSGFGSIR